MQINLQTRRAAFKLVTATCAIAALGMTSQAFAQSTSAKFPDRPVKVIVALAAGGSADMIARTLGQKLSTDRKSVV